MSLYALTEDVLLRVGKRWWGNVHLSPQDATKVGRGLIKAAESIEKRRKQSRRGGR